MTDLFTQMHPSAIRIVDRLVQAGYEAYIVGGAIRDCLLDCDPKDFDITTNATPEQVQQIFGRRQCMIIGRRFRLAQVRMGDILFEVSTFRRTPSTEERKGRYTDDDDIIWNDNQYGTLDDDVTRRDFTINALYYNPLTDELIDKVGGVEDLRNGIVRVIGDPDTRFMEDPVRMLRALKLVGIYQFQLDSATAEALAEHRGMIQRASTARLYEELIKILQTGHALSVLTTFQNAGFLDCFWLMLASLWETREGKMTRCLLHALDQHIRAGYSNSKALALSAMAIPYVSRQLEKAGMTDARQVMQNQSVGKDCCVFIREFFDSFVVPRAYTLRVRDILLLVPMLFDPELAPRYYQHPEYKYARLLVELLTEALGWPHEAFDALPEPGLALSRRAPRRRRPRGRKKQKPESVMK